MQTLMWTSSPSSSQLAIITSESMGDRQARDANSNPAAEQRTDQPVRSRWTPKPEQILILESIFNSGMVNPPKEETVRIRKLLEKFGAVGDANVFYWFQNRRSRSRRRQRQIQASLNGAILAEQSPLPQQPLSITHCNQNYSSTVPPGGFAENSMWNYSRNGVNSGLFGSSSSSICRFGANSDDFFSFSNADQELQLQHDLNTNFCLSNNSNFHNYQTEMMTVFINGVAMEVVRGGAVDIKGMFSGDYILFHSSGIPVEVNEYGFVVQGSLQHGESYFLVPRCA